MAFEIGPRENEQTWDHTGNGWLPPHKGEAHQRVINGTTYIFARYAYESGLVTVQVIVKGRPIGEVAKGQRPTDVHFWTNQPE